MYSYHADVQLPYEHYPRYAKEEMLRLADSSTVEDQHLKI